MKEGSPIEYHSFWKQEEEEALLCAAAKIKGQQKVLLWTIVMAFLFEKGRRCCPALA